MNVLFDKPVHEALRNAIHSCIVWMERCITHVALEGIFVYSAVVIEINYGAARPCCNILYCCIEAHYVVGVYAYGAFANVTPVLALIASAGRDSTAPLIRGNSRVTTGVWVTSLLLS